MSRLKVKLVILWALLMVLFSYPIPVLAHAQTIIIEMTSEGFKPAEVSLDSNSTVIFVNQDNKAHWPASDIHPTHDIYPQFDPKKGLNPKESWTFKPKIGEWRFHDHLFPHFNGKLIVIPEKGLSSNQGPNLVRGLTEILNNLVNQIKLVFGIHKQIPILAKEDFIKLNSPDQFKALQDLADSKGGLAAWEYVKDTYQGQAGSSGNIHDLAHLAGGLLFKKMGFAGLGKCSADFAFGCFHGFLDQAFAKSIDKLAEAHQACLKLEAQLSGPVASCIHGIGHGVASFYSVTDLKKALSTCRKLESGSEYCFDGVFMEFARNAPSNYIKEDDPLYPCDSLEKEFGYTYSSACGRNQPSLLLSRLKMSFEQVIPICLSANSAPFRESCIDSLGFSLAASGDSDKIIQGCQMMGQPEFISRCLRAAAGELVFQDVPLWKQKSQTVCESFPQNLEQCLGYVNKLATDYHRR